MGRESWDSGRNQSAYEGRRGMGYPGQRVPSFIAAFKLSNFQAQSQSWSIYIYIYITKTGENIVGESNGSPLPFRSQIGSSDGIVIVNR